MDSNKEIIEVFLNNDVSYGLSYYLNDPQYVEIIERYLEQENKKLKKRIKNILLGHIQYQKSNEIKQLELLLDEIVIDIEQLQLENERLTQQKLVGNETVKKQRPVEEERYTALITWISVGVLIIWLLIAGILNSI